MTHNAARQAGLQPCAVRSCDGAEVLPHEGRCSAAPWHELTEHGGELHRPFVAAAAAGASHGLCGLPEAEEDAVTAPWHGGWWHGLVRRWRGG